MLQSAAIAASVLLSVGCDGSASSPSAVSLLARLEVAGPLALKVGDSATLTAASVDGATRTTVVVSWLSDHPEIVSVDGTSGVAAARMPGRAVVTASDRSQSSSLAITVVPDVSGVWVGTGHTTIVRISGLGPVQSSPTADHYYELRITQTREVLQATDWAYNFADVLAGTVDDAGLITMQGGYTSADRSYVSEINRFTAHVTAGRLNGSYVDTSRFSTFFGPQVIQYTIKIIDLVR